jgi:hypothetical protein
MLNAASNLGSDGPTGYPGTCELVITVPDKEERDEESDME